MNKYMKMAINEANCPPPSTNDATPTFWSAVNNVPESLDTILKQKKADSMRNIFPNSAL